MGYRPDAFLEAYPNEHIATPYQVAVKVNRWEQLSDSLCSRAISTDRDLVLNGDVLTDLDGGRQLNFTAMFKPSDDCLTTC